MNSIRPFDDQLPSGNPCNLVPKYQGYRKIEAAENPESKVEQAAFETANLGEIFFSQEQISPTTRTDAGNSDSNFARLHLRRSSRIDYDSPLPEKQLSDPSLSPPGLERQDVSSYASLRLADFDLSLQKTQKKRSLRYDPPPLVRQGAEGYSSLKGADFDELPSQIRQRQFELDISLDPPRLERGRYAQLRACDFEEPRQNRGCFKQVMRAVYRFSLMITNTLYELQK